MILRLSGPGLQPLADVSDAPFIGRITEDPTYPEIARGREILRVRQPVGALPGGFRAYFLDEAIACAGLHDVYVLATDLRYLADGDVIRVEPTRLSLTTLYRRASPSNSFLVTERCDNFCLMCSQPPKPQDDGWIVDELLEVIPLVSPATREIGLTGGEPVLLGERLIELLAQMKMHLPTTAVHILSNGRRFADAAFARALAAVRHPDLMVGIPLYSDLPEEHDYVVQAHGAFEDTIAGILNLKRWRVRVELRFVIHAETWKRLYAFARFVSRNLRFVDHVALMGLELVGFAKTNLDELWIDPIDYQGPLALAVEELARAGMRVSIYNHPLCVLPQAVHPFARRSISDWKNRYFEVCDSCARKSDCGGFFASATVRRSRGIHPLG